VNGAVGAVIDDIINGARPAFLTVKIWSLKLPMLTLPKSNGYAGEITWITGSIESAERLTSGVPPSD